MFDAVSPSIDCLLDRCQAVRMRRDRQSGVMGQLNQQVHFVGTELSSHDIGSGCSDAAAGHHLGDVNPTLIDHPREVAQGRDGIRVECARTISVPGSQSPPDQGHELVAVGLLMLAGLVDLDELDRWRIGWERRRRGR
jgi:hypothetical protein